MSTIIPNTWNSFDEYQEYQLFGNSNISNIYNREEDEQDNNEEDSSDSEDDIYVNENKEEKEEKEEKEQKDYKFTISYVSPLPTEEIIDIVKNVPNSFFNSFGRIVFDKPAYLSEPTLINASVYDSLTISYIQNPLNEDEHKHRHKELIEEVFNAILNIISKDDKFKIVVQNTFYEMEVSYTHEPYNEKFKISLFTDKENNYNVIIVMKGIKRDNVCNLFFFYNIHRALGDFYEIKSYKNRGENDTGEEEEEEEIGIHYLPHRLKRNIYLLF